MKAINLVYIVLLLTTLSITGSCDAQTSKKEKSSGGQKKETRNVPSFNSLDLAISANVLLKQGSGLSLELEGDADDLEKIETEVSGSTLKIKTRPGSWNIGRITVYLTMQSIEELRISGSGSIKAETDIKTNNLDMNISGSGNISIPNLSAKEVSSEVTGSGNISFSGNGSANYSKMEVTGSGNINAENFVANSANVRITGSGDCKVNASDKLEVNITGSGSVFYKGKAMINADVTGSGKVRQI
jgi:hypothetical protein